MSGKTITFEASVGVSVIYNNHPKGFQAGLELVKLFSESSIPQYPHGCKL